jgi:hypothetical protein
MQQHMHLTAYEEHATATLQELEGMRHENAIPHSGTLSPSEQDHELKVTYHHLSKVEHGWNYTRQQLDLAREEVDTYTHTIMHLEHTNEQQDLELKERASMIATLEQQLQVF